MNWMKRLCLTLLILVMVAGLSPAESRAQSAAPVDLTSALTKDLTDVQAQLFTPFSLAITQTTSFDWLIVVDGMCTGSVDGKCGRTFFYLGNRLLGTDIDRPEHSSINSVQAQGIDRVLVSYDIRQEGDVGLPSRPPVTLVYSWDGTQLVSQRI